MLIQKNPAGLVDEWRIGFSTLRWFDENSIFLDSDDLFPRNKLGRFPPTVFNVNSSDFRERLGQSKYKVVQPPDPVIYFPNAYRSIDKF
jgi:hypothetical protein